jgi:hypothetical protein
MTAAPLPPSPDRCSHSFHPLQAAFHPDCPELRKLAGIGAANAAAPDDVKARIDAAIRRWAAKGVEFSANDLRSEFEVTGAVVGARFNAAAKAGVIVDTGKRVPSTLPSTKGHEVRLWRGAQAARWSA